LFVSLVLLRGAPERSCKARSCCCEVSSGCGFWFSLELVGPHDYSPLAGASLGSLYASDRPHTTSSGGLFAIRPDVAKLLAVVALREGILSFTRLHLDGNVAEVRESEDVLRHRRPGQCYQQQR
jgi:hypothetical protein